MLTVYMVCGVLTAHSIHSVLIACGAHVGCRVCGVHGCTQASQCADCILSACRMWDVRIVCSVCDVLTAQTGITVC